MKILVVSFYYEPEIGAAPNRITNLVRGLKERGAQVDVLTCLPNYPKGRIMFPTCGPDRLWSLAL